MLPHDVACCTLLVARCTLQLRLQRNAICVALFNFLVRAMATAKETQDTGHSQCRWTCVAECGMQLSKRKSSPHPRGHVALGASEL